MAIPYSAISKYIESATPEEIFDALLDDGLLKEKVRTDRSAFVEALEQAEERYQERSASRPMGQAGPNLVNALEDAVRPFLNARGQALAEPGTY